MTEPILHFVYSLDDFKESETRSKGWYAGAVAELAGCKLYPLTFYDPGRLAQEVASAAAAKRPCLDEVALIVVPEISKEAMRASVNWLHEMGWFNHLAPSRAPTPWQALGLEKRP